MNRRVTTWVGVGSPEGVVPGPVGTLFFRRDGVGVQSKYIKNSGGGGNTGWAEAGFAADGEVTPPAHFSQQSASTLVTTTTAASQIIMVVDVPDNFRGAMMLDLVAAGTANYEYKFWYNVPFAVHMEGATPVVDVEGVGGSGEVGTTVGAATLELADGEGTLALLVTPANTNSVRWSAIITLNGVIEAV